MKLIKKLAMLAILAGLATASYAESQIKVICDRDGETVYLNGQFKTTCDNGEPVPMMAEAGKYTVVVKKDNGDGSYYYYKKSFRIGDGIQKIVEADSNIHYTEKYYYIKFEKSKSLKYYWAYLEKYPHGKYVATVKNYLDNYYWKRCNSIDGCKTYLSKISWGKYKFKAKQKLEDSYYLEGKKKGIVDLWTYLKKYPHGKYVKQTKKRLNDYYYKRCQTISSCSTYLNKIDWDNKRKKEVKTKLEKLYAKQAINTKNYGVYLNRYPNGKYAKEVSEEKMYNNIFKYNKISNFTDYLKTYPNGKYNKKIKFYLSHIYNKIIEAKCQSSDNDKNINTNSYQLDSVYYEFKDDNKNIYILGGKYLDSRGYITPTIIKVDPKTGKQLSNISIKKRYYKYPNFLQAIKYKDGFLIAVQKYLSYKTSILRVDNIGKIIWEKKLNYNDYDDDTSKLSVLKDGTFVFNTRYNLLRIDDNGNILWDKKIPEDNIYTIYDNVIILIFLKDGHIQIREFEKNGNEFWRFNSKYKANEFGSIKVSKNGDICLSGSYEYWYQKPGWVGYSEGTKSFDVKIGLYSK